MKRPSQKQLKALKAHFDKTHIGKTMEPMGINAFNSLEKVTDKKAKEEAELHRRKRKEKREGPVEENN